MTLPLSKYVWFDKKYVLTEKAKVPITTHAIHYGTSIFEGIRAYWNGKNLHVFRLDEHVKRFRRSGQYYNISLNYSDKIISDAIIEICKKNNIRSILDFGAGICNDSINAAKNNLVATAADIPGKTFDFGKWRIKKYKVNIKTIDILNETPLIENYDAITCFEVLQHVVHPKKTLEHIREHQKSNGLLFVTARFKNNYSLALKRNEYLENEFEDFIKKCNLRIKEKIHMWGEKEKAKFLYVLKK